MGSSPGEMNILASTAVRGMKAYVYVYVRKDREEDVDNNYIYYHFPI